MTALAYTDEQQIEELLYEIRSDFDEISEVEIYENLDDLLAQIRLDS